MEEKKYKPMKVRASEVPTLAEDWTDVMQGGPFTNQRVEGDRAYITDAAGQELEFIIVPDSEMPD